MSEYIITSVQIKAYFININTKIIVFSHKQTASVTKPIRFGDKSSCVKSRKLTDRHSQSRDPSVTEVNQ